jgi:thiamine biosynthesis protein ThiS
MEVIVNNKATVISESATLEQLISELNILSTGMAMAVNKQLIPRTQWKTFSLKR